MAQPDEVIHQQTRLKIMATLRAIPEREWIEFTRLRAIVETSDGNLGSHIAMLGSAGYITVAKDFIGKRPRTRIRLTRTGRTAFTKHVEFLRTIIDTATTLEP